MEIGNSQNSMLITLLVFILILGLLVFVHELGHFLVAKRSGVRVEEFAFGFRPRIWGKKIGETQYAINLIPLGGYVRLYGEQSKETGPRSFRSKSIRQRLAIFVAGAAMNLILAWLILTILFTVGFNPLIPGVAKNPFVEARQHVLIREVVSGSPADQAGLKAGETVVSVDGQTIGADYEFVSAIGKKKGQEVAMVVKDQGENRSVKLVPRVDPPAGQGAIGVIIESVGVAKSQIYAAPAAAIYETGRIVWTSLSGFFGFLDELVVKQRVSENVTGIVGIGHLTSVYRRLGFEYLAQLVALISAGLGIINLMPILPLDGGHIAALAYEKVRHRPLTEKQFGTLWLVGLAFILALFLIVTYKDIIRFNVVGRIIDAL